MYPKPKVWTGGQIPKLLPIVWDVGGVGEAPKVDVVLWDADGRGPKPKMGLEVAWDVDGGKLKNCVEVASIMGRGEPNIDVPVGGAGAGGFCVRSGTVRKACV